jgi:uncharacterized membrane protein YgdD (TMEM256/DUF423 family)
LELAMSARVVLFLAAMLGCLSVMLGAFGAHGLSNNQNTGYLETKYAAMEPKFVAGHSVPASYKYLIDYKTGVEYQMAHSLALGLVGLLMLRRRSKLLSVAAGCFLGGICFFSGSLYLLVIAGPRWLGVPWGAITPIGGTLMLIGWLSLAIGALRTTSDASQNN